MNRVFIPEPRQFDEAAAKKYCAVVPLVPKEYKLGLEPDRIKSLMARSLLVFEDDDYLLLDGPNTHCAVAGSVLSTIRNSFNLLMWNSLSHDYLCREINFDDIPKINMEIVSSRRIFVVNNVHDIKADGDMMMIALTDGNDPNILNPDKAKEAMIKILANSGPEDHLLLAGAKIHNLLASSIMSRMHGKVNYMIWDLNRKEWVKRTCIFTVESLQRLSST
jgi:hypothetical protein